MVGTHRVVGRIRTNRVKKKPTATSVATWFRHAWLVSAGRHHASRGPGWKGKQRKKDENAMIGKIVHGKNSQTTIVAKPSGNLAAHPRQGDICIAVVGHPVAVR